MKTSEITRNVPGYFQKKGGQRSIVYIHRIDREEVKRGYRSHTVIKLRWSFAKVDADAGTVTHSDNLAPWPARPQDIDFPIRDLDRLVEQKRTDNIRRQAYADARDLYRNRADEFLSALKAAGFEGAHHGFDKITFTAASVARWLEQQDAKKGSRS